MLTASFELLAWIERHTFQLINYHFTGVHKEISYGVIFYRSLYY